MTARVLALFGLLFATTSFGAVHSVRSIVANANETILAVVGQGIVVIGDFTMGAGSQLIVTISPGPSTPLVTVGGVVTLNGPTLVVNNTGPIIAGTVITVISNDGPGPIVGTFNGLPEGAIVSTATGQLFRISYVGGSGNDVTLTALAPVPLLGTKALLMLIAALAVVGLRAFRSVP